MTPQPPGDTPTPRTDAEEIVNVHRYQNLYPHLGENPVRANFARALERELTTATKVAEKQRVEAAITKADRCMNHDGAMKVFSPLVRDLASELTAALSKAKDFEKLFNEAIEIREDLRVELADAIAQVESEKADAKASEMMLRQVCEERDTLRRERDEAMQWLDKSKADLDDCRAGRDAARRQRDAAVEALEKLINASFSGPTSRYQHVVMKEFNEARAALAALKGGKS